MRNLFTFLVCWMMVGNLNAQKHDYLWILGQNGRELELHFTPNSVDTVYHPRGNNMDNAQATISDSSGTELLFYTNAAKVYSYNDSIMQNGDSLNYGWLWDDNGGRSYPVPQGIIALPTDSANIWNLFHVYQHFNRFSDIVLYPWRIYQTRVDVSTRQGLGNVKFKNKTVLEDTLSNYAAACKHANGRDWWMLANKTSSNCLYTMLIQNDTVIRYPTQCIGNVSYLSLDGGQAVFSPNGDKFAWCGGMNGIVIYDFDRCSGALSNPRFLNFTWVQGGNFQYGVAFSPNSRFLYLTQSLYVMQFDTDDSDIPGSVDTVGYYQPPTDTPSLPGPFFLMQLAPDGKIYISSNNTIRNLHVINEPDRKGDSCHFVNYGLKLPSGNTFGIPNYPNYRLGALIGSPCDTLRAEDTTSVGILRPSETDIRLFPNPASSYIIIDYGFTDWSKGDVVLEVTNSIGQIMYQKQLPRYSGFHQVDVSQFASGLYTVTIKRKGEVVATGRFVRE